MKDEMKTAAVRAPLTAKAFLFASADGQDSLHAITRVVNDQGLARSALRGFRHLSRSTVHAIGDEISAVADGLLEVDLGDALVMGWRKYFALIESAKRTLASPGAREVLPLAAHSVTWSYRPRVDLLVDSVKVNSFEFDLEVAFDLTAVTAVLKSGNLVAVRFGDCVVTASLSLEGAQIARRRRSVDSGRLLDLRHPIPLLGVSAAAPVVPQQAAMPAAEVIVDAEIDVTQDGRPVRSQVSRRSS